jgi:hypothetical protein
MPNWVNNAVSFTANSKEEMDEFVEILTRPRPYLKQDPDQEYRSMAYAPENLEDGDREFSFWNVVRPEDSILHEYWGDDVEPTPDNRKNHWYDWNSRNWGCKWDAKVEDEVREDDLNWNVMFDTPWGPPLEFYEALLARFPEIHMEAVCIEEQGWGVIYVSDNGALKVESEWDIPTTHKEHEETLGMYGLVCRCELGMDSKYWHDDCPKPENSAVIQEAVSV